MPPYIDRLKSPDLYDQIIQRLSARFGNLPDFGVAAGQSVASAIYDIVGLSADGRYRDLDIFIGNDDLSNSSDLVVEQYFSTTSRKNGIKRISGGVNDQLSKSSYDGIFDPINKNGYSVTECLLLPGDKNYVIVDFTASNVSKVQCIVQGFDLNCCESGIDFKSKEVYWTPAFEKFLRTKELEITNYLTPAHSIVRAAKKACEMDFATFDKRYFIKQAQTVRKFILDREEECGKSKSHKGYFFGHMFSDGYLSRFEKQKSLLGEHFLLTGRTIKPHGSDKSIPLYVLTPKQWDGKLLNLFNAFHQLINEKSEINRKILKGFYDIETDLFYINEITKVLDSNNWRSEELFNLMSIGESEKVSSDGMRFLFNILFSDKAKLLKSMSQEEKIHSAKLIASHTYLGGIQHLDWSNDDIRLLFKNIRKIDKGPSRFMIGEIESLFNLSEISNKKLKSDKNNCFIVGNRNKNSYSYISKKLEWLISPDFEKIVEAKLKEKLAGMDQRVANPLFSDFISNIDTSLYSICELKSEQDLFFEGNTMKHCVGGYWDSIRLGNSFIFSVIEKANKSNRCTLELGFNTNARVTASKWGSDSFVIKQNQSYKNVRPENGISEFCTNFVRFCNESVTNVSEIADLVKLKNRELFVSALRERVASLSSDDDYDEDMAFYN